GSGAITGHGRKMAAVPAHPRLAHMVLTGGRGAGDLAALLEERDPIGRGAIDLSLRREAIRDPARFSRERGITVNRAGLDRIRTQAKRLRKFEKGEGKRDWAELAAIAYPDRIGLRRAGEAPRWVLSGGKGARIDAADPMAGARLIVATNLDGDALEARVRQAIEISEASLRDLYGAQIKWREVCEWSRRERRVLARRQECFGALVLADQVWNNASDEALALAALDGVRQLGLQFSPAANRFRARVALARGNGADLPDLSDAALLDGLEGWLPPYLGGCKTEAQLRGLDLLEPLRAMLDWGQTQLLDAQVPAHFKSPMGRKVAIDYALEVPEISVRLQEMFGVTTHPLVGGQPLRVTLLSPAGRPLQTTTDLVNFWATSYRDVRKDMRGRYPKHPWPENPTDAAPTLRAKPRKQ
ncbi:MAG: ATP-dependent helicase HrpB, partial [Marinosulfonomonas sp.]|nr:ATP-dependent helicase HrpB [Marinosulfonomonas sp.]